MSEFSIFITFIAGGIVGVVCLALLILAHNIGAQSREIQWHDAKLEIPTKYVYKNPVIGDCINLLVIYDNGSVHQTFWKIGEKYYCAVPYPCKVTHFAYLAEIEQTTPKNIEPPCIDYRDAL